MMRGKLLKCVLILAGGAAFVYAAEYRADGAKKKTVIKPRATHQQIAKRQKPQPPRSERKEVKREDVLKTQHRRARQKKGLLSRSSIVSSAYDWTMVPKGAVLHVPPLYQKRINKERSGKLIGWKDFYGKNRSWIRTVPVTLEQARGESPISPEYLEALKGSGVVLVAVCKGGPISVLKPKEEPANQDPQLAAAEAEKAKEKAAQEKQAVKDLMRRLMQRRN